MKLKSFKIKNFRGYRDEVVIDFNDMTAIVGRNDIGKSTILEAMDIFFNEGKGVVPLDDDDFNVVAKRENDKCIRLVAVFTELPDDIILDDAASTNLRDEYLLNVDGNLEVVREITSTTATGQKVKIIANHPNNPECNILLHKKQSELQKQLEKLGLECDDKRKNTLLRKAIWAHYADSLDCQTIEIEVLSKESGIKDLWEKLKFYIPQYSLFQSDRKNADGDDEVQEPLKMAVKTIMNKPEIRTALDEVAMKVREALQEVSDRTVAKVAEMNPDLANELHPTLPEPKLLKWPDVFKNISIAGESDIPLNKRGSGIRRLILLNFFRAEAERQLAAENTRRDSIIYAIEEPETSQHYEHQQLLVKALLDISIRSNAQVVITTHSSEVVKSIGWDDIRIVNDNAGVREITLPQTRYLPYNSISEINYLVYGLISVEYHDELYGYLHTFSGVNGEYPFDTWLYGHSVPRCKYWNKIKQDGTVESQSCTLAYYIRNKIHHPENALNNPFSDDEMKQSIAEMISVIGSLH